jgi:tRNA pseudouridine55 synthase
MEEYNDRLFIVDKAVGPTSFDVVAAFKRAAGLRKVGHTGTLDPLATGVLLICTGVATRAVEHFMDLEKEYEFDVCLGVETDTLDKEGKVVQEAPCPDVGADRIREVAASFVGEYDLEPPVYSALKKNGRRVQIYDFEVTGIDLPVVGCRIRCSRGTYVRSLARDFGRQLDTPAHIDRIARTRIGPFERSRGFSSDKLSRKDLSGLEGMEMSQALDFLPGVVLVDKARKALQYGMLPGIRDVAEKFGEFKGGGPVRILDPDGALLAVGQRSADRRRNPLQLIDSYRMFIDSSPRKGNRTGR